MQTGCVPGPGWCVFVCFVKFCICIHHTITTHHRNKLWICFFLWYGAEVMVQPRRVFVKFGNLFRKIYQTTANESDVMKLPELVSRTGRLYATLSAPDDNSNAVDLRLTALLVLTCLKPCRLFWRDFV